MKRGTLDEVYTYWNERPCNIRHSTKEINSVEFFDEVAEKKYKVESHKREFLALEKWEGKTVLELGCGLGTDAIQFAKAGAKVICIDLTKAAIDLCKKNFEVHGLQGTFFQGNIESLDTILPESYRGSFDLIYSFGVIHHTPNPKKVFEQIPAFLKADGEVRCMLYSRFSYKLFWLLNSTEWDLSKTDSTIQKYSEAQEGCPVTYTYTFDEITELINPGLTIESIWKDHIFTWDIPSYRNNIFIKDTPFQNVSPDYLKQLEKELGWHTIFIARKT